MRPLSWVLSRHLITATELELGPALKVTTNKDVLCKSSGKRKGRGWRVRVIPSTYRMKLVPRLHLSSGALSEATQQATQTPQARHGESKSSLPRWTQKPDCSFNKPVTWRSLSILMLRRLALIVRSTSIPLVKLGTGDSLQYLWDTGHRRVRVTPSYSAAS